MPVGRAIHHLTAAASLLGAEEPEGEAAPLSRVSIEMLIPTYIHRWERLSVKPATSTHRFNFPLVCAPQLEKLLVRDDK